mmetsp:Transcript_8286/g.10875  ORF Transcript_8286/g.10875 Transcript_8286/m.10875 type:complete len:94 (+) Transcript_8286:31-312(+)
MVSTTDPYQIEVKREDIVKEGFLFKQSRYIKDWRKRFVVLTKTHLITYRDNVDYKNPTEVISMDTCCTVKSTDDEMNKANSFKLEVKGRTFYL